MATKLQVLTQWLLSTRNYTLTPPTAKQQQLYNNYATIYFGGKTAFVGTIQGYSIIVTHYNHTTGVYTKWVAVKLYNNGKASKHIVGNSFAQLPRIIATKMAHNTLHRGVIQPQWVAQYTLWFTATHPTQGNGLYVTHTYPTPYGWANTQWPTPNGWATA